MIQTLLWSIRYRLIWIVFFLCLGLLGRGFLLGTSNLIGAWVDYLTLNNVLNVSFLIIDDNSKFLFSLTLFIIVGFFITWIYRLGFSDLCALMVSEIYDEITYRTSRFPISFFDKNPIGRIVTRFSSDYGNVFRLFGGPLAEFLSILFDLLWMVALMGLANWRFLPFLFLSIFFHFLIYSKFQPQLRKQRRLLSQLRAPSLGHFAESIQGATPIRIFNKEVTFTNRFLSLDLDFLKQKIKTVKNITFFTVSLNLLAFILYLSIGVFSWWGIQNQWLTLGDMGIAFGLVALSGNTVQMFFEWLTQFEEAIVGLERLNEYLHFPLEEGATLPFKAKFPTPEHFKNRASLTPYPLALNIKDQKIIFKDIWFRYGPQYPWILKNINFEMPMSGERLGIIGRTGAGKSSIIQCLFQIYPIENGSIQIGPYTLPMKKLPESAHLDFLREFFAYIPQDPFLFRGTLLENLDPRETPDLPRIEQLLRRLGKSEWISKLNENLEERGKNFSSGERQLVQLIRILIQNRPLLVMDEATSNIDPRTEDLIVRTLNQELKNKSQIIIAHRLETLESCHRILWLDKGEIKMLGTPQEVLPQFIAFGKHQSDEAYKNDR